MELSDDEKRLRKNAYMREWKRRNREKVNAINRAVKAKNPELYKRINRESMARMREEDPQRFLETNLRYRRLRAERYLVQHARHRAKKLGVEFDLVETDVVIPEFCPVLGIRLEFAIGKRGSRNHSSPSLDRLDPKKGYTHDNVRVISNRANHLKNDGTIEEFKLLVAYLDHELRGQIVRGHLPFIVTDDILAVT